MPDPKDGSRQDVPPDAIPAGNGWAYPDSQGGLHRGRDGMIRENQRVESDQSRGSSGGCGQDADRVPPDRSGRGG